MPKRVLAIGLEAAAADYTHLGGLTPEVVRAYLAQQLERVREAGYELTECLVDPGTAELAVAHVVQSQSFDCVVFGAGVRDSGQLVLFERLLNLVHAHQPQARLCFNSNPADTLEAVRRWI
jgi:hypothetical protein